MVAPIRVRLAGSNQLSQPAHTLDGVFSASLRNPGTKASS